MIIFVNILSFRFVFQTSIFLGLRNTLTLLKTQLMKVRDFDFLVDLLEKRQQYSDAKVIISLYARTN